MRGHSSGGGRINRRSFVCTIAAAIAGARWAPRARASQTTNESAPARAVDDPAVKHGPVSFRSGEKDIDGYLARPDRKGSFPGLVVIPGNWIIEPYIPEFAAQLAQAGLAALVVNILHQFPKVKSWEEAHAIPAETTQKIIREQWTDEGMMQDVRAAIDFLTKQEFVALKKVGITGFCGGGWNSILFAADHPELIAAVVAFYPPPDAAAKFQRPRSVLSVLGKLRMPLQTHFGTRDPFVPMPDIERFRTAVSELEIPVETFLYDADHGFMAYNREGKYEPEDAKLAFQRATAFFHKFVR